MDDRMILIGDSLRWIGADGRAHWRVTDDRGAVTECCGGKHDPDEGFCLEVGQLKLDPRVLPVKQKP